MVCPAFIGLGRTRLAAVSEALRPSVAIDTTRDGKRRFRQPSHGLEEHYFGIYSSDCLIKNSDIQP